MRRVGFVGYGEESGDYVIPAPAMIARTEKLIELVRAADSGACPSICVPSHESCSVTDSGACLGKAYAKAVPMLIGAAHVLADADFGAAGWTPETEHAAAQLRAALRMLT
jgi:hypothetical protein